MSAASNHKATARGDDEFATGPARGDDVLDLTKAYRSYHEPLVSFLSRRLPDKSIASDIAQSIFVSLAARPPEPPVNNMRQYLFRAARNQLAGYYRRQHAQTGIAALYAADPVAANRDDIITPEDEAIRQDKLTRLRMIINAMPKKRRSVFILSRFQEMTDTEIAARLGMKKDAVRQHVSRAMRDCQTEMKRIFDESTESGQAEKLNGRAAKER